MEKKDMTAREFATKMEVTYTTVIRWLKSGIVPGAYTEEVVPKLVIWRIPESALKMKLPKSGPRPDKKKSKR
jgi:hypothetical protein